MVEMFFCSLLYLYSKLILLEFPGNTKLSEKRGAKIQQVFTLANLLIKIFLSVFITFVGTGLLQNYFKKNVQ